MIKNIIYILECIAFGTNAVIDSLDVAIDFIREERKYPEIWD